MKRSTTWTVFCINNGKTCTCVLLPTCDFLSINNILLKYIENFRIVWSYRSWGKAGRWYTAQEHISDTATFTWSVIHTGALPRAYKIIYILTSQPALSLLPYLVQGSSPTHFFCLSRSLLLHAEKSKISTWETSQTMQESHQVYSGN